MSIHAKIEHFKCNKPLFIHHILIYLTIIHNNKSYVLLVEWNLVIIISPPQHHQEHMFSGPLSCRRYNSIALSAIALQLNELFALPRSDWP